jgi:hypothetical protein
MSATGTPECEIAYLSEDETVQLFTEILNHVVSLGFTVDEQVKSNLLLELNGVLNLGLHSFFVSAIYQP